MDFLLLKGEQSEHGGSRRNTPRTASKTREYVEQWGTIARPLRSGAERRNPHSQNKHDQGQSQ